MVLAPGEHLLCCLHSGVSLLAYHCNVPPAESGTHGMRYSRRVAHAGAVLAHRGEGCTSGPLGRALAVVLEGLCFIRRLVFMALSIIFYECRFTCAYRTATVRERLLESSSRGGICGALLSRVLGGFVFRGRSYVCT